MHDARGGLGAVIFQAGDRIGVAETKRGTLRVDLAGPCHGLARCDPSGGVSAR